jgi:heme exporter protein C
MPKHLPLPLILPLSGSLSLACCQYLIYFYAPAEAAMGPVQKIFYIHLPLAWWALFSFFLVFLGSIAYLLKRAPGADRFCAAAAETGVLLSGLALLTGMIWARKSWGVWWTWDPRLTTTLVMWFIYAGYLVLRGLNLPARRKSLVCAVVGVVAFLDVPLVFVSARIWRSIHPAVLGAQGGGLEPEMKLTLAACVVAFGLFWAGLVWLRKCQLDLCARMRAPAGTALQNIGTLS